MKHVEARPYAKPEAAARQLVQLAASIEPVQDGRIHIENQRAVSVHAQGQCQRVRRWPEVRH